MRVGGNASGPWAAMYMAQRNTTTYVIFCILLSSHLSIYVCKMLLAGGAMYGEIHTILCSITAAVPPKKRASETTVCTSCST